MGFWSDWLDAIAQWISSNNWNQLPQSVLFITLTSISISAFSAITTKLLIDTESLNEDMQKINKWNQKRKMAMERADKKLWLSVKREEDAIKRLQQSMMMKRMKPMLVTSIPFMVIFAILRRAFNGHYYAWIPFNMGKFPWIGKTPWSEQVTYDGHVYSKISFTFWYFLSSFAFGSLISRILGTNPQGAVSTDSKKKSKTTKKTVKKKSKTTKKTVKKNK
ncbi:MAG: EMC3/TMCO1 family protein [Candidatus Heimdallarchaeaceae archaeon]